ncbi:hypothetical protein ACQPZG_15065 [Streptomyces sp. CA-294286]|uniref:hypothetical protein n=1 Tax=Streptomyces sp. CA-294286 TaxID=3240070 RepID=UPI003D89EC59
MTSLLRKGLLVLVAVLLCPVGVAFADDGEADLGHHGYVVYEGGRLTMQLRSWNHGPDSLASGAVRVSFSAPVEGRFPRGRVRTGPAAVVCETGELRAGAAGGRVLDFGLRVKGAPAEVVVEVRTVRTGSAEPGMRVRDANPGNDRQRVLAPATGDVYYF